RLQPRDDRRRRLPHRRSHARGVPEAGVTAPSLIRRSPSPGAEAASPSDEAARLLLMGGDSCLTPRSASILFETGRDSLTFTIVYSICSFGCSFKYALYSSKAFVLTVHVVLFLRLI